MNVVTTTRLESSNSGRRNTYRSQHVLIDLQTMVYNINDSKCNPAFSFIFFAGMEYLNIKEYSVKIGLNNSKSISMFSLAGGGGLEKSKVVIPHR